MTEKTLAELVVQLRSVLSTIDAQLGRAQAPPEGLEDLKSAVDTLRTNVWAILSAGRSSHYKGFVERFRLRRANEVLRATLDDIDTGAVTSLHPEHVELQIHAQQLVSKIGRLKPGDTK